MKSFLLSLGFAILVLTSNHAYSAKLSSSEENKETIVNNGSKSAFSTVPDIAAAFKEFTSLKRSERRERIKASKNELKLFKQERKAGNQPSTNTLLLVILALLLPPLAVYLHEGVINSKFWISLILTLLFFIPGVIYALIVVLGNG